MRSLCAVRVSVSVRCVLSVESNRMRIPALYRIAVLSVLSEPEFVAADHRVRHSRTASHIGRITVFHSVLRL